MKNIFAKTFALMLMACSTQFAATGLKYNTDSAKFSSSAIERVEALRKKTAELSGKEYKPSPAYLNYKYKKANPNKVMKKPVVVGDCCSLDSKLNETKAKAVKKMAKPAKSHKEDCTDCSPKISKPVKGHKEDCTDCLPKICKHAKSHKEDCADCLPKISKPAKSHKEDCTDCSPKIAKKVKASKAACADCLAKTGAAKGACSDGGEECPDCKAGNPCQKPCCKGK